MSLLTHNDTTSNRERNNFSVGDKTLSELEDFVLSLWYTVVVFFLTLSICVCVSLSAFCYFIFLCGSFLSISKPVLKSAYYLLSPVFTSGSVPRWLDSFRPSRSAFRRQTPSLCLARRKTQRNVLCRALTSPTL